MSHIPDGDVQAYLDGAYDALGQERLAEIEEQLAADPAFAARVEELRRTMERASSVLAVASPLDVEMPPFEEIQQRAAARPADPPRHSGRRVPRGVGLAWAATVILALGTGWFVGRDARPGVGTPGGASALAEVEADGDGDGDRADLPATGEGADALAAEASTALREGAPPPESANELESLDAPSPDEAPRREAMDVVEERARALESDRGGEVRDMVPPPSPVAAPAQARSLASRGPEHTEHSMAIPGLRVLGVSWHEGGAISGLRIDHLLPTGDTLQLIYVDLFSSTTEIQPLGRDDGSGADAVPALTAQIEKASLPAGWELVVVRKESRWVVARAPLTQAEIRAYLMSLN